jgi:hypothetical protein
MNSPGAIVVAAGLIAGALIATSQGHSQTAAIGRYAVGATKPDGSAVWWLDTSTGNLVYCRLMSNYGIQCGRGTNPEVPNVPAELKPR